MDVFVIFFRGPMALEIFKRLLLNRLKLIKYYSLPSEFATFKKTSSELICDYQSFSKIDEF